MKDLHSCSKQSSSAHSGKENYFFSRLVDACIPARNKQSCPSWRKKNTGPKSCTVIREAPHRFRRLFTLFQLPDLVPEYKKMAKIHCQCLGLFYLQLSLHKAATQFLSNLIGSLTKAPKERKYFSF